MNEAAIQTALDAAAIFMQNRQERLDYLNREIAIMDYESDKAAWMDEARAEGKAEGKAEGLAMGRSKGLAEGKSEALLYSVKSLMKNMNLTLESALDILGLKGEERKAVIEEIKELSIHF